MPGLEPKPSLPVWRGRLVCAMGRPESGLQFALPFLIREPLFEEKALDADSRRFSLIVKIIC